MAFNAKEVKESTGKLSQFIKYGVQELKINDITFKASKTGSEKLEYHVEGRPIADDKFEGKDGAKGQIGTVSTSFLKAGSDQEEEEFGKLVTIGRKAGVDMDSLPTYNSLKEAVAAILPLIKGKFVRLKVTARFYWGTNKEGATVEKYSLGFARFKFAENITEVPKTEMTFDINNQYDGDRRDLGAKPESSTTTATPVTDDLPF